MSGKRARQRRQELLRSVVAPSMAAVGRPVSPKLYLRHSVRTVLARAALLRGAE
jgi:hypothetical protein